jgi:hypothetical protein
MKMVKKYALMVFLLISASVMVPICSKEAIIVDKQEIQEVVGEPEKAKVVWYKRPAVQNAAMFTVWAAGMCVFCYSGFLSALLNGPKNSFIRGIVAQDNEISSSNSIQNCIVFGETVQTDGKSTVVIPSGGKPISIKQDAAGTWVKENNSGSWVFIG